jgi:hypothetical protein
MASIVLSTIELILKIQVRPFVQIAENGGMSSFVLLSKCSPEVVWVAISRCFMVYCAKEITTEGHELVIARRMFLSGLASAGLLGTRANAQFPPLPSWQPDFFPDLDEVADHFRTYLNGRYDFVVFEHATCCIVPENLSQDAAAETGKGILSQIIGFHPDMNPQQMRDGNVLVSYNHPAFNIIPATFAREHWPTIEQNHQRGLTANEVLITPLGANIFDNIGKMALLGRSYMFMDALNPVLAKHIQRD